MTVVVIERCVMRIRRTAGWSWGASPDALLAAATRALPRLLARQAWHDGDPVGSHRITAPVRVHVSVTVAELLGLDDPTHAAGAPAPTTLEARVATAVARALAAHRGAPDAAADADREDAATLTASATPPAAAPREPAEVDAAALVSLLARWHRAGWLAAALAAAPDAAIDAWHATIFERPAPSRVHAARPTPRRDHLADVISTWAATVDTSPRGRRALRLAVVATALGADAALAFAATVAAVRDLVPLPTAPVAVAGAAPTADPALPADATAPPTVAGAPRGTPGVDRATAVARDVEIAAPSVLPFLLLPALHHAGWLDTARALLAAHRLEADGFALAAALAGVLVAPPERGWQRAPRDRAIIAAFAGRADPIADHDLVAGHQRLAPLLPGLDAVLRDAVARGRAAAAIAVVRDADRWMAVDLDGLVVLAAGDPRAVVDALPADARVAVTADAATPGVLERLDLTNRRFVTAAAPVRDEPWRRVPTAAGPCWTNDTHSPAARVAASAAELAAATPYLDELRDALRGRCAVPRGTAPAIEAASLLATTAALADLSARLFAARERVTPILAWQRFASLDARVRVTDDRVVVRVPLGRRHADLLRAGVLGVVPAVPWFGDRAVDLGGA